MNQLDTPRDWRPTMTGADLGVAALYGAAIWVVATVALVGAGAFGADLTPGLVMAAAGVFALAALLLGRLAYRGFARRCGDHQLTRFAFGSTITSVGLGLDAATYTLGLGRYPLLDASAQPPVAYLIIAGYAALLIAPHLRMRGRTAENRSSVTEA